MQSNKLTFATALILLFTFISGNIIPVLAVSYQDILNAQKESERLRNQVNQKQAEGKSLENEISRMDNQIRMNELEIQDTQGQIQTTQNLLVETNSKIDDLTQKLSVLDATVVKMEETAQARIKDAYKKSRTPELTVFVSSKDFSGVLKTFEYYKAIEEEDTRVLAIVNKNRQDYREQKQNLENLKNEKENLKNQLQSDQARVETQKTELEQAQANKNELLRLTESDESRYRQLLAENEARISSMRRILAGNGAGGASLGYFNRGDLIGRMGSTGCSTGPHLHFGVIAGGGFVNPWPYFNNGSMGLPVNSGAYISQDYSGAYHNGIDWAQANNSPLYATKAGYATLEIAYTKQQILNSSWCPAKWAVQDNQWEIWLRHADGTISVYAHVNP